MPTDNGAIVLLLTGNGSVYFQTVMPGFELSRQVLVEGLSRVETNFPFLGIVSSGPSLGLGVEL